MILINQVSSYLSGAIIVTYSWQGRVGAIVLSSFTDYHGPHLNFAETETICTVSVNPTLSSDPQQGM